MHGSVIEFLRREIRHEEIFGQEVLEIGSQNVNGTPRTVIEPLCPARYVGVDFTPGAGVDLVIDATRIVEHFGPERFDVVVSTEMLEHAADWRSAVRVMKRILRPGGLLVVTARGPGFPFHGYPDDHWRFTVRDFQAIFEDLTILALQPDAPDSPGVLMKAMKPETGFFEADLTDIEVGPVR